MSEQDKELSLASRLLHGAKDLIWESEPASRKTTPVIAQPKADQGSGAVRAVSKSTVDNVAVTTGAANNSMSGELLAVVMSRPTAYSALAEAIAALADIPMDEATRYRSAFAVLKKTQQRTAEQITQAIELHLAVLDDEIIRFKGQSKSAEDGEITARNEEIAALQTALEQGTRQMDKLREETQVRIRLLQDDLNQKHTRAQGLAREAEEKKRLIGERTQHFESATELVRSSLLREKEKCLQFLA